MYYKTCPYCGANLDPNEDCDCLTEKKRRKQIRDRFYKNLFEYQKEMEELQNEPVNI